MYMPTDNTKELMTQYIGEHGIPIVAYVWKALTEAGYKVELEQNGGNIWDATLNVKNGNHDGGENIPLETKFIFYNTFLEILTKDRDADPLEFDSRIIEDEDYIFSKIDEILRGRLTVILGLLDGKTGEQIYEENPDRYERISVRIKELPKESIE